MNDEATSLKVARGILFIFHFPLFQQKKITSVGIILHDCKNKSVWCFFFFFLSFVLFCFVLFFVLFCFVFFYLFFVLFCFVLVWFVFL